MSSAPARTSPIRCSLIRNGEGRRFVNCRFIDADLRGARLDADALVQARLSGARVDVDTAVRFAAAHGLRVDNTE